MRRENISGQLSSLTIQPAIFRTTRLCFTTPTSSDEQSLKPWLPFFWPLVPLFLRHLFGGAPPLATRTSLLPRTSCHIQPCSVGIHLSSRNSFTILSCSFQSKVHGAENQLCLAGNAQSASC